MDGCCYKHYLEDFLFNQFLRLPHPSPNSLVSLITECKSPRFSPPPHSHQAHFNSRHIFQHPSRCRHIHKDFWFNAVKFKTPDIQGEKPAVKKPPLAARSRRGRPAPCRTPGDALRGATSSRTPSSSHPSQRNQLGTQNGLCFPSTGQESKHRAALVVMLHHLSGMENTSPRLKY